MVLAITCSLNLAAEFYLRLHRLVSNENISQKEYMRSTVNIKLKAYSYCLKRHFVLSNSVYGISTNRVCTNNHMAMGVICLD